MKHVLCFLTVVFIFFCCAACGEKKDADALVVGTNAEFPPFEMRGGANGNEIVGFDMDVAREIAAKNGKKLIIEDMKFDALIPALNSGKVDMVFAGMTVTPERARNVDFSVPYYKVTQIVLLKKGDESKIKKIDDLKGKKIAVALGTTGDSVVSSLTSADKIIRFDSVFEAILELKNSKADVVLTDEALGGILHARNPDLARVDLPFEDEYYAAAVKKGNKELLDQINTSLTTLKDTGEMDILLERYFSE